MNPDLVIYTEKIDCQDCYKCIKVCPVKSIKIEDFSATVIDETCIHCGKCINACPPQAKRYRDETEKISYWADRGEKMIACVAPSFLSDFGDIDLETLLKVFYCLGFSAVSETAIGAELVAEETNRFLRESDKKVVLATCCPSVVSYIKIYYPEYEEHLAPIVSPMIAHVRLLREAGYGDHKMVFLGPCIAKKKESDIYENETDAVLTFEELHILMEREGITFEDMDRVTLPDNFVLGASERAGLFPVDNGMISTMSQEVESVDANFMSFSGMKSVMEVCEELKEWKPDEKVFVELMACDGGCIKGPATSQGEGIAAKRNRLLKSYDAFRRSGLAVPLERLPVDLSYDAYQVPYKIACYYSDWEIQEVLNSMGKTRKEDELNCTGCGYDNCREFAAAYLEGKAEREMCISQMRKEAQSKASVLLRKMPYGVVLVDDKLKIVDTNEKFIKQGGEEIAMIVDALGSLAGADLSRVVSYSNYFQAILTGGEDSAEYEFRDGEKKVRLSLVSIQPHKIVCGIIQPLDDSEMIREVLSEKIRRVIQHNAESVQRIAYILGESASYTEDALNMIIETGDKES